MFIAQIASRVVFQSGDGGLGLLHNLKFQAGAGKDSAPYILPPEKGASSVEICSA